MPTPEPNDWVDVPAVGGSASVATVAAPEPNDWEDVPSVQAAPAPKDTVPWGGQSEMPKQAAEEAPSLFSKENLMNAALAPAKFMEPVLPFIKQQVKRVQDSAFGDTVRNQENLGWATMHAVGVPPDLLRAPEYLHRAVAAHVVGSKILDDMSPLHQAQAVNDMESFFNNRLVRKALGARPGYDPSVMAGGVQSFAETGADNIYFMLPSNKIAIIKELGSFGQAVAMGGLGMAAQNMASIPAPNAEGVREATSPNESAIVGGLAGGALNLGVRGAVSLLGFGFRQAGKFADAIHNVNKPKPVVESALPAEAAPVIPSKPAPPMQLGEHAQADVANNTAADEVAGAIQADDAARNPRMATWQAALKKRMAGAQDIATKTVAPTLAEGLIKQDLPAAKLPSSTKRFKPNAMAIGRDENGKLVVTALRHGGKARDAYIKFNIEDATDYKRAAAMSEQYGLSIVPTSDVMLEDVVPPMVQTLSLKKPVADVSTRWTEWDSRLNGVLKFDDNGAPSLDMLFEPSDRAAALQVKNPVKVVAADGSYKIGYHRGASAGYGDIVVPPLPEEEIPNALTEVWTDGGNLQAERLRESAKTPVGGGKSFSKFSHLEQLTDSELEAFANNTPAVQREWLKGQPEGAAIPETMPSQPQGKSTFIGSKAAAPSRDWRVAQDLKGNATGAMPPKPVQVTTFQKPGAQPPAAPPPVPPTLPPSAHGPPPPPPKPTQLSPRDAALLKLSDKIRSYMPWLPPVSRLSSDTAASALQVISSKALDTAYSQATYKHLNMLFPNNVPALREDIGKLITQSYLDDSFQQGIAALREKYPAIQREAWHELELWKMQNTAMQAKFMEHGWVPEKAASDADEGAEFYDYVTRQYARNYASDGAWAKVARLDPELMGSLKSQLRKDLADVLKAKGWSAQDEANFIDRCAANVIGDRQSLNETAFETKGGRVSDFVNALKARKDIHPIYRRAMGETTDGVASAAWTYGRQKANLARLEALADLANTQGVVWAESEVAPLNSGYVQARSMVYGKLNGKYVRQDVFDAIKDSHKIITNSNEIVKAVNSLTRWRKFNLVIGGGPQSMIQNAILGDIQFGVLSGGVDPFTNSPGAFQKLLAAVESMNAFHKEGGISRTDKSTLFENYLKGGGNSTGFAQNEISAARDLTRSLQSKYKALGGEAGFADYIDALKPVWEKWIGIPTEKGAALYDWPSKVFRYANWLALREQGLQNPAKFLGAKYNPEMHINDTMKLVHDKANMAIYESFPQFEEGKIPPWLSKLRQSAPAFVMNPFMTYKLQAMQIYSLLPARMAADPKLAGNFFKLGLAAIGTHYAMKAIQSANGISEQDVEAAHANMPSLTQSYKAGMHSLLNRDEQGRVQFVDLSPVFEPLGWGVGNQQAAWPIRALYNGVTMPAKGGLVGDALDMLTYQLTGGAGPTNPGFNPKLRPWQLGTAPVLDKLLKEGYLAPTILDRLPQAMQRGGLLGEVGPKDFRPRLTAGQAISTQLGMPIIPGGTAVEKRIELKGQSKGAKADLGAAKKVAPEAYQGLFQEGVKSVTGAKDARKTAIKSAIQERKDVAAKVHEINRINSGADTGRRK